MRTFALSLVALPVVLLVYAYLAYPALLWVASRLRAAPRWSDPRDGQWPRVSITVPAFNAQATLGPTLDHLLATDYPADRRQIIVVSDASTDATDDLARSYAGRGVELLRMPQRLGKTAAENAAVAMCASEIVVNVDASILVPRDALKALIRPFGDPTIGVASGRDVSVTAGEHDRVQGEQGYVGWEMWVRSLETRLGGIVGASGCFFAFRKHVRNELLPEDLSWDFATPLVAHQNGFRAVSVDDAVCLVPRTAQLRTEVKRKVRTMARGLSTMWYKRALLNPLRHGAFALKLLSHKVARWLVYLAAPLSLVGLALLAPQSTTAAALLGAAVAGLALGAVAIRLPRDRRVPLPLAIPGFATAVLLAGTLAWWEALRRQQLAVWEPTPRARLNGA
jgi:cellulose synthase/poly-beta-1,6-N-acetylglucosamine synthase-like glycosyltransferase